MGTVAMLAQLETLARQERQISGEYIRPVMLLQAQPKYHNRESLTVEVVEQTLLNDHNIPAEQIHHATGEDRELEGVELSDPACKIRYVITVQAFREGWDCPFAYVLCSVAELRSSTAVEQILGRVLRLPHAQVKHHPELNLAYAFAASQNFATAANELETTLVENGFQKQEAADLITAAPPEPPDYGPLFKYQVETPKTASISITETPNLAALSGFSRQADPGFG